MISDAWKRKKMQLEILWKKERGGKRDLTIEFSGLLQVFNWVMLVGVYWVFIPSIDIFDVFYGGKHWGYLFMGLLVLGRREEDWGKSKRVKVLNDFISIKKKWVNVAVDVWYQKIEYSRYISFVVVICVRELAQVRIGDIAVLTYYWKFTPTTNP